MKIQQLKTYAVFAFTAVCIYLGYLFILRMGWISRLPPFTIHTLLFFSFFTALIFKYITWSAAHGAVMETQFYLASIVLKLLIGCAFLWVLIALDRANANNHAILFLVTYIIFTGVEIMQLMASKKG